MKSLFFVFVLVLSLMTMSWAAPSIDRLLQQQIAASPLVLKPVVITFDHKRTSADFLMLKLIGIVGGQVLRELPIVLTKINANQFNALKLKSGIRSLYANHAFKLLESQAFANSDTDAK